MLPRLAPGATFEALFGAAAAEVTLRMLLGMRSGVADFDVEAFDAEVLAAGDAVHAPDEFVAYAATVREPYERHFVCAPGSCVTYSSTNYQLLGLVLLTHARLADPAATWESLDVKPRSSRAAATASRTCTSWRRGPSTPAASTSRARRAPATRRS